MVRTCGCPRVPDSAGVATAGQGDVYKRSNDARQGKQPGGRGHGVAVFTPVPISGNWECENPAVLRAGGPPSPRPAGPATSTRGVMRRAIGPGSAGSTLAPYRWASHAVHGFPGVSPPANTSAPAVRFLPSRSDHTRPPGSSSTPAAWTAEQEAHVYSADGAGRRLRRRAVQNEPSPVVQFPLRDAGLRRRRLRCASWRAALPVLTFTFLPLISPSESTQCAQIGVSKSIRIGDFPRQSSCFGAAAAQNTHREEQVGRKATRARPQRKQTGFILLPPEW